MTTPFLFLRPIVAGIIRVQTGDASSVDRTADMLLYRISVMPPYLSWPMIILTVLFDAAGILRTGHRFRSQSFDQQTACIQALKRSRLGLAKDFVLFYEKMGTFIYFAQKEEQP